jgi:hypothetical protein
MQNEKALENFFYPSRGSFGWQEGEAGAVQFPLGGDALLPVASQSGIHRRRSNPAA